MKDISEYTPEEVVMVWNLFRNSDADTKIGRLRELADTEIELSRPKATQITSCWPPFPDAAP